MLELIQGPDDSVATDPPELASTFMPALPSILAKDLAQEFGRTWDAEQETDLQQAVSKFVAAAKAAGLSTITLVVTRPTGQRVSQVLDIDRFSKTRSLQ